MKLAGNTVSPSRETFPFFYCQLFENTSCWPDDSRTFDYLKREVHASSDFDQDTV